MILWLFSLGVWTEHSFGIRTFAVVADVSIFLSYIWAAWSSIVIWQRIEDRVEYAVKLAAAA